MVNQEVMPVAAGVRVSVELVVGCEHLAVVMAGGRAIVRATVRSTSRATVRAMSRVTSRVTIRVTSRVTSRVTVALWHTDQGQG